MAGRKLTAEQEALLETVRTRHIARANARLTLETQAKAWVREHLAEAEKAESLAVRAALAAGVPRARIGQEGLGSKDYHTVTRILAVTEEELTREQEMTDLLAGITGAASYVRLATAEEHEQVDWPTSQFLARVDWDGYEREDGAVVDLHGLVIRPARGRFPYAAIWEDGEGLQPSGPLTQTAGADARLTAALDRLRNES